MNTLGWEDEDILHRRFSIIGEAAWQLKKQGISLSGADWAINLRNTIVHQYDAVTLKTILKRVELDFPEMLAEVSALLKE